MNSGKYLTLLGLSLVSLATAQAAPYIACATGDSLGGVNVQTHKKYWEIVLMSQADEEPAHYKVEVPAEKNIAALKSGQTLTLTGRSEKSIDFGGATSDAVLMHLQLNKERLGDRTSFLAEKGVVYSLSCTWEDRT